MPAPLWPEIPVPTPHPYQGSDVPVIMCGGDSIAVGYQGTLAAQLLQTGRQCVIKAAGISGSSTCQWRNFWFTNALATHQPDFVVMHFLGNEPGCAPDGWDDPLWLTNNQTAFLSMQEEAESQGIHFYTVIPAASLSLCQSVKNNKASEQYKAWAKWQDQNALRPIDARSTFGGDVHIKRFLFSNNVEGDVRVTSPGTDCSHYTPLGYNYLSNQIRLAIAGEWT